MTDRELRELCQRYFDAIERRDVDGVAELYAPDFVFWVNLTGGESSREQNLATLRDGYALLRRRCYDDRIIDTFATGFLCRYSVNVVQHDGRRSSFSACIVAQCKDGRITRIDEYLDSSKFRRPKPEATP
jgi:ketosteroid isomerase-like protein